MMHSSKLLLSGGPVKFSSSRHDIASIMAGYYEYYIREGTVHWVHHIVPVT